MPAVLVEVQQQELREELWFSGKILSRNRATLVAENKGRIISVPEVGDYFKQGERIVQFDNMLLQQELTEQKAASVSHQANIKFLTNEAKRLTELAKNNNAALSQLEQAQANLDMTKAMYAANQARVAHTAEVLRRMEIVAPFNGVINQRYAEVGEWLSDGDAVAVLTDPQNLEVMTAVPGYALPHIKVNDVLDVEVDSKIYPAVVRAIVPVADDVSRLFELRLNLTTAIGYAQQLVRVAVPISSGHNSLVVPEDALVIRNTGMSVMMVTPDQKVQRVPVQVGISTKDGLIEVRSTGLHIGDRVIIRGAERIREGMLIRPITAEQSDPPQQP